MFQFCKNHKQGWRPRGRSERGGAGGGAGFTMIEILVTLLILSVIMAAMFTFLWAMSGYWKKGQNTADMTENARLGLNRMTRELMQAAQVTVAQAGQVSFEVNFNDGAGWQTVTYGFTAGNQGAPGTVWRTSSADMRQVTLINDVSNAAFSYFGNDYKCDADNDGIVTLADINRGSCGGNLDKVGRVDISLTMAAGSQSQTIADQAWIRNRPTD